MDAADGGGMVDPDQDPAVSGDDHVAPPASQDVGRPGRRLVIGGAAALVATLAVGVAVGANLSAAPEPVAAVAPPAPVVTVTEEPPAPVAGGPVAEPARVAIPRIGVDAPLIDLFVSPEGTMGVPTTAEQVGWWEDGPVPGEPGASLIAAHVSLGGTPGAFVALDELTAGDEVTVDRVDGSVATYVVTSVEQFAKDAFPDERVYSYDGPTRLHLVTCGGAINPGTGHYEDNVVVFADLVADTRVAAGA